MIKLLWLFSNIHTLNGSDPSIFWRNSYVYSNWLYRLAGYVAEQVSGSSWEDLVKKHYFTPLKMEQAFFIHKFNSSLDDFAKFDAKMQGNDWWKTIFQQTVDGINHVAPAGAICATSNDLLKYMKFLLTQNASKSLTEDLQQLLDVIHETWLPSNVFQPDVQGQSSTMFQPRYPFDSVLLSYGLGWNQGIWRSTSIMRNRIISCSLLALTKKSILRVKRGLFLLKSKI